MDFVAAALTAMAIVVAWIVFRFERHAARRRDVAGARAVLTAVQRGMIEGMPELGPEYVGWGEIYFSNEYDGRTALLRGNEAYKAIKQHGWDQVFVVPTEPLALLATTSSDLVSEETIFAANFALWRVCRAGSTSGWYGRLKLAVAADIARLKELESAGIFSYGEEERHLRTGDVLAAALAAAVIGVSGYVVANALADGDTPGVDSRSTA